MRGKIKKKNQLKINLNAENELLSVICGFIEMFVRNVEIRGNILIILFSS